MFAFQQYDSAGLFVLKLSTTTTLKINISDQPCPLQSLYGIFKHPTEKICFIRKTVVSLYRITLFLILNNHMDGHTYHDC